MLNSEEEKLLNQYDQNLSEMPSEALGSYLTLPIVDTQWLVEKLKEVNNEASKYSEELQKTNEELARVLEVYGP